MTRTNPSTIYANLEFAGRKVRFRLFDTPLCQQVCQEIFQGESYPMLPIAGEIRTILDVGANIGAAAVYFAVQYPQAKVIAIEPSARCGELLRENARQFDNIEVHQVALSNRAGNSLLYQGKRDAVTASLEHSSLNLPDSEEVELVNAAEFVASIESGVDLLKLDTEGHELPILESLGDQLPSIAIVYVEYHSEADRRVIDGLFAKSHLLWRSRSETPHRGELAYVRHDCVPHELRALAISG